MVRVITKDSSLTQLWVLFFSRNFQIPGFLVQFGVAADPKVQAQWQEKRFKDDPKLGVPFTKGTVSFAGNGVDSRSSHIFISDEPHGSSLGNAHHERPFGRIEDPAQQAFLDNW